MSPGYLRQSLTLSRTACCTDFLRLGPVFRQYRANCATPNFVILLSLLAAKLAEWIIANLFMQQSDEQIDRANA